MASSTFYVLGLLGLALLGIGELLHIVGLATPEWSISRFTSVTAGLWESCSKRGTCLEIPSSLKTTEIEICEAFAIIGMLCGLLAAALGLFYLILSVMKKRVELLAKGVSAAGSVAFGFILLCVIIWGAAVHNSTFATIGYSFALSIAGGVLLSIGGIIIYMTSRQGN